jgi:hypothetical protein
MLVLSISLPLRMALLLVGWSWASWQPLAGLVMSSLLFPLVIGGYLLPTAIAAYRDHLDKTAICLVNVLLGWTVLGWVVALAWSCAGRPVVQPVAAEGDEVRAGRLRLQGGDPRLDR